MSLKLPTCVHDCDVNSFVNYLLCNAKQTITTFYSSLIIVNNSFFSQLTAAEKFIRQFLLNNGMR